MLSRLLCFLFGHDETGNVLRGSEMWCTRCGDVWIVGDRRKT